MHDLIRYFLGAFKKVQEGTMEEAAPPADPPDIGDAMTQEDIDFVKRLRQELTRFDAFIPSPEDPPPE